MTSIRTCPQCQAELPNDAPDGACPQCLLQMGLASAPPVTEPPTTSGGFSGFTPPTVAELAPSFPQLEILELIGQGGMGAVYKARQPALDRIVALKILPPSSAGDPAFAERFNREARALARLSHPQIVAVYDSGQAGSYFYLLMEYVDGANLRQLLRAGKLEPREALAIVPQICEALQFAHDEGIVHRDIKPENVLIDKRGRVKVADFGLAKLLARSAGEYTLTGTHQVMGTPHYMAPEQWERPSAVDHRADIYALGVVLYEMLTGELPLGRFDLPSHKVHVDVRLDDVVLRALAKEPDRRYQHASEVKTDMDNIGRAPPEPKLSDAPPQAEAESAPAELAAAMQKIRGPAIGLIVAGALVLALHLALPLGARLFFGTIGLGFAEILMLGVAAIFSGPLLILGGLAMYHRFSYALALIGAVVALFPCASIAWVITLPIGIWALVILTQEPVKAAFRGRRAAHAQLQKVTDADREAARRQVAGPAVGLIVVGLIDLLSMLLPVVGGAVLWFIVPLQVEHNESHPRPVDSHSRTTLEPGLPVELALLVGSHPLLAAPAAMPPAPMILAQSGATPRFNTLFAPALLLGVLLLGSLPLAVLLIVAGFKMRQLQLYPLAVIAAIAAILPCHIGFLIGLPVGIWALVVLSRNEVRAAF